MTKQRLPLLATLLLMCLLCAGAADNLKILVPGDAIPAEATAGAGVRHPLPDRCGRHGRTSSSRKSTIGTPRPAADHPRRREGPERGLLVPLDAGQNRISSDASFPVTRRQLRHECQVDRGEPPFQPVDVEETAARESCLPPGIDQFAAHRPASSARIRSRHSRCSFSVGMSVFRNSRSAMSHGIT